MNHAAIQEDFDEIARLSAKYGDGNDRYERFLVSQVPAEAETILDVGCGLGRLAAALAAPNRAVLGVDLSPEMIAQARKLEDASGPLDFKCGNFLEMDLPRGGFDCVISAAVLHHMPAEPGIQRMLELLRPGGTVVIHDLRSAAGALNHACLTAAGIVNCLERFIRTGRLFQERALREAWAKHGARERYLAMNEVRALAERLLPSATVYCHWFWMYTIVWKQQK
jgi:2-polyprenyl-3-methyl-5-hydroxy-6-metoxy-1,4-benzoquinol methylase